jgi:hypothetical protein
VISIRSHRPSRLPFIFGLGAALVLSAATLTVPTPARAFNDTTQLAVYFWSNQVATAGVPFGITVEAQNAGNQTDYCFNDEVHFAFTDPSAVVPANYGFLAGICGATGHLWGDGGTHWFYITPVTAGPQTLTVTDVAHPTVTPGTVTIDVAPGPATSLTISGMPANSVQGADTHFRLTARDAWDNVATGYTGTVVFESTDPGAGLPGGTLFNAGDAGTRMFWANFLATGLEIVTARDNVNSTLTVDAYTTVAQAPHFDVQCYDQIAGEATSCSLTARTAGGAIDTGYHGTVHFTSSDPSAVLDADYVFQIGQQGQANGFAPTFKTAGVQTLSATDKNNGSIYGSGSLTVSGGDTTGVSIVGLPSSMVAGPVTFTVKTTDARGNWGSSGSIHFTSNDTKALLPADYTFHSSAYGTHQFTVTVETPGTVTLTVTGSNWLGSFSTNASTHVLNGSATQLAVSTANPYVAGVGHAVTVAAKDAYGNTDSGYHGTVHFTSSDPAAGLPADYTFIGADAGVHTFSVTLNTAGSQGIRATDTVTATITGAKYGIVVTPGAAKTLAVSGIASPYVAGVAHSVTVTALDAYGNTATGYRGTVGFTSTDTKALLPANYTFTAADSGVHRFSLGVTLKRAGTQAVRARDTVTTTITGLQSGIVVTAAAATTLTVSGLASPRTAGVAGTITVTAHDAYGNVATGYRGTVTFTSTDSHALLPANYTFTAANAGTHTFSVTLKTAGTQAVRARDTVTATITGLQGGIVVT